MVQNGVHKSVALALVLATTFLAVGFAQQVSTKKEELAEIRLSVTDERGIPIKDATAQVLKWSGKYEPVGASATSDEEGLVVVQFPKSDDYFYAKVNAPDYAMAMLTFHLDGTSTRSRSVKLSRPVESIVEVFADNEPVEGAELTWLEYTDANGESVYLRKEHFESFGFKPLFSNARGRLPLPAIPSGSKLTIKVLHPSWAQEKLAGVVANSGVIGSVHLQKGVSVSLAFAGDDSSQKDFAAGLEGKHVDVLLHGDAASRAAESILHRMEIHEGRLTFSAHAEEYRTLRLEFEDFFASPYLANYPDAPNSQLDLRDGSPKEFKITLLPKRKARGRLVDDQGNGIPAAFISSRIARQDKPLRTNEFSTTGTVPEETGMREFVNNWISGGSAESDKEGNFEVELAQGHIRFEVIKEGYFSLPVETECDWSGNLEDSLPTKVLHPVPTIRGKVLNATGEPQPRVVVRLKHTGRGDADPFGMTESDGSFSLKMSRIPYRKDSAGLLMDLHVMAFDPKSNSAGLAAFNVLDRTASSQVQLTLEAKPAGWALNPFGDVPKTAAEEAWAKTSDAVKSRYPDGAPGKSVPDLREGTWLNTDAKSLADFRGKCVLLDFWFIGCGPCIRDMPSVKIAHEAYKELGFSVVSIHNGSEVPQSVEEFARANNLTYPIVVDHPDNRILDQFKPLGVIGFPSYILLGPDGKIIRNDAYAFDAESLRNAKLEIIHSVLHR